MRETDLSKQKKVLSRELREKTLSTIIQMAKAGEEINFYTVSERAEVSRTFLYKHDDIRQMIEKSRITKMSKQELREEVIRLRINLLALENHSRN